MLSGLDSFLQLDISARSGYFLGPMITQMDRLNFRKGLL